ncbi:MAG: hypothetical protein CVT49_05805 [candidate division Zixibacteria bacterium HGW-Zixibacteria-1]|nr:MAG: hypothetical protein CVT49_05805 [candidate division Zixibacteria bacterium HGW-Zixibacteria-1]
MKKFGFIFLCLFLLIVSQSSLSSDFYPNLVVNYSDFSHVSSIAAGYQYVYFGTTHGIIRYDKVNNRWDDPLTSIDGFYDRMIYEIKASFDDENLWVRTDVGNFEYSETLKSWRPIDDLPNEEPQGRHLKPDPFYFAPWGFNYMPSGYLVDDNGREFRMTDIVDDGWANLWIGTWGLGAARADIDSRRIKLLNFGLLYSDITTICLNDGVLWMGGLIDSAYRTGVTGFDWRGNNFSYVEYTGDGKLMAAGVYDLYADGDRLYAATDDGVWIIDPKKNKFVERLSRRAGIPDDLVLSILVSGNYLLAGTRFGLGVLELHSDTSEQVAKVMMPSATINCLEKADEDVWIGTDNGVFRWSPDREKLGRLSANELSGFWVINDLYSYNGKMWVAGENELASIDLNTAAIKIYPEVMNYGGVKAVAAFDTLVAVATGNGLLIIYDGEKSHYQLFTANDGIISNYIRDLLFDGDYLWLATDRGLTRFWYKNPAL